MQPQRNGGPLSNVTVLDLTQFLACPYGTQILGDLGARIIKIETADGDITRKMPPHFYKGDSAYFLSVNRNKESLVLNLKEKRGRELFLDLVRKADVVIENYRPGVVKRLGIDYAALRTVNPRIVMCSISGFGQDGPYRDRPAYDIIIQAISGGMSLTGEEGGKPVRAGIPLADLSAGMFAAIGALAGLAQVGATGEGAFFDVSMMDCQVSMLTYQAVYYLMSGEVPGLQGRGHRSLTTYRAYMCQDGIEIVVAANTEKMWESMCDVLGLPELPKDPRFLSRATRLQNRAALDALMEGAFAKVASAEVLEKLERVEVPAAPINSLDRVFADPQVKHREMLVEVGDADNPLRLVGNPVKVAGIAPGPCELPHHLGSDSESVLQNLLGLTPEQTSELARQGVIGATCPA
jgi:crotonobetainyl-CoA:carnitine CoA-transferase CaiB-like acyl-CoA transferase